MQTYEYSSFYVQLTEESVIQEKLNLLMDDMGKKGWRLHTCEPVANGVGPYNYALVVLDRAYTTEDVHEEPIEEGVGPHVIEMRNGPS